MTLSSKKGLLLINLGTPERPEPRQVKAYLKEFLMDPFVIDIPYVLRWLLVNAVILANAPQEVGARISKSLDRPRLAPAWPSPGSHFQSKKSF